MKCRVLFIFGTRPEAIKLAPLIRRFQEARAKFRTKVCFTSQHQDMALPMLNFFSIKPDFDLKIMKNNQSLFELSESLLLSIEKVLSKYKPDLIFVQGDTTTTFMGALAGFYHKIKVAHVEAGLRSFDKYSPFPEEMNRTMTSHLADYNFTPTKVSCKNLIEEGVNKKKIWVVGNTIVDALYLVLDILKEKELPQIKNFFSFLDSSKKILLVTAHRRESFGKPLKNICYALVELTKKFPNLQIVYPVHLNPNVQRTVYKILKGVDSVFLLKPLDYHFFVWLMEKSALILTDSGGIQEEAPSLGKPVLVARKVTERPEVLHLRSFKLIGTDKNKIVRQVSKLLSGKVQKRKSRMKNPYGDGKASDRIFKVIEKIFF